MFETDKAAYCRFIASLVPKGLDVTGNALSHKNAAGFLSAVTISDTQKLINDALSQHARDNTAKADQTQDNPEDINPNMH